MFKRQELALAVGEHKRHERFIIVHLPHPAGHGVEAGGLGGGKRDDARR